MLTGNVPFSGTTAEVIRQHIGAPLPLDRLGQIPKPVAALLQSMLEKDPEQRPQDPMALQAAVDAAKEAIRPSGSPHTLTRSGLATNLRGLRLPARRWISIGAVIIAVALVSGLYLSGLIPGRSPEVSKSVAVLPFDNLSNNQDNEYFNDGLTSEVIYELSKVADLSVIARSSILQYKDTAQVHRKPLNQIGAELGVGAILESTVQRIQNRVKIVTILYDAHTGRRLWGESYDREIEDLFAIQSDLATQIAGALQARLSADERANLQRKPTTNLTAYDLYLQGLGIRKGSPPRGH